MHRPLFRELFIIYRIANAGMPAGLRFFEIPRETPANLSAVKGDNREKNISKQNEGTESVVFDKSRNTRSTESARQRLPSSGISGMTMSR